MPLMYSIFEIIQILFMGEFWIMVADHDQTLVFVLFMPFPQRRNYGFAVNSTKGPHIHKDHLPSQTHQTERSISVEPNLVF